MKPVNGLKSMSLRWKLALAAALVNDVLDLLGPGTIPVIGDALDLITTTAIYILTGETRALPTIVELIPLVDPLPVYTASVLYLYRSEQR